MFHSPHHLPPKRNGRRSYGSIDFPQNVLLPTPAARVTALRAKCLRDRGKSAGILAGPRRVLILVLEMRLWAGNSHVLHFQGHSVAQPRLLWSEKWCQKWWFHRELLGIWKTFSGESQSSSVSAFCLPVQPEQWARDWFWRSAPT